MATTKYRLFKGFKFLNEFESIFEAKQQAPKDDGVYNLLGSNGYRDSWQIVNGAIYNQNC